MKQLLLTALASCSFLFATAQNIESVRIISSSNYETCTEIGYDTLGNLFVAGLFSGTIDLDPNAGTTPLTSTAFNDGYVAKYDPLGNIQWARQLEVTGGMFINALETSPDGSVLVSGWFIDTIDLDPGIPVVQEVSTGAKDIFLLKLTADGNYLWSHTWGNSNGDDEGLALATDANDNIFLSGLFVGPQDLDPGAGTYTATSTGTQDAFLLKLDAAGLFQWAGTVGTTQGEYISGLHCDSANNIVATGQFWGTMDVDPGAGVFNLGGSSFNSHGFAVKWSGAGALVWGVYFVGSNNEIPRDVVVHSNENIFICGAFRGTTDFDPGAGTANLISNGSYDAFVVELDANGNYINGGSWGGSGTDDAIDLGVTTSGDLFVGGFFSGSVDFDIGATQNFSTSLGGSDFYTLKIDNAFNYAWTYATGSASINVFYGIDTYNELVSMCGHFNLTVDFSGGAGTNNISSISNSNDGFWVEFDNCPITTINQTAGICAGDSIYLQNGWQTLAGTYYDTIDAHPTCDTIIATQLTLGTTNFAATEGICVGDSFFLESAWQTIAGNYIDTFTTSGCDSIVTTTLTLHPNYTDTTTAFVCDNDSILIGGTYQNTPGFYTDSYQTQFGCDSTVVTELVHLPSYNLQINSSICDGDSLLIGSIWQTSPGLYVNPYQSVHGCDSIILTVLTVNPNYNINQTASFCTGDTLMFNGTNITQAGIYVFPETSVNGCDSTITLTVSETFAPVFTAEPDTLVCSNDGVTTLLYTTNPSLSYIWHNGTVAATLTIDDSMLPDGPYTFWATGTNSSGCSATDSVYVQVETCFGIADGANAQPLKVFPNPTTNYFDVEQPNRVLASQITVYTITGKQVLNAQLINQKERISTSDWPAGVYFVIVRSESDTYHARLIKQ